MDYGNYNGNGYCPAGYSAHERWLMGWLTPTELTSATTVTDMPALNDKPQAYLIRNDGFENEYYLVENRQQKGWDTNIPGKGILIFHIDYDPTLWVSVKENVKGLHSRLPEYDV
jgi:M6 family metalloprotease-like protein